MRTLSSKKIIGLAIAFVLVIGMMSGGSWAYFSDNANSSGRKSRLRGPSMKSRWWFLALVAILGLVLFSSLSVPVAAATPTVKLVLGGTGAIPWAIGNIAPGNSGTNTVTLSNTGSKDGVVTIWISDIVNSEGANPESETGDTAEPGELGDYLTLNVSGTNLSTDFTLPAKIGHFPQSAADTKHIYVNPLKALSTLNLQWEWQLPPETGNDVQGDRLTFTINYVLEEFPPLPSPQGGGGGGEGPTVNQESITVLKPEPPSEPGATMSLIDTNNQVAVGDELDYNIQVTNQSGTTGLHNLMIVGLIPDEMVFVSATGSGFTIVGQEVRFSPIATLKPGEIVRYQIRVKATVSGSSVFNATMRWDEFGESIVNQEGTTVFMPELTAPSVPLPYTNESIASLPLEDDTAKLEVRNLTVSPGQVQPGDSITITYEVINTGGQSGEFTLEISIPGLQQTSQLIKLEAGQTQAVSLTLPPSNPGIYQVDIGGVKDTFTIGTLPLVLPAPSGIQKVMSVWLIPALAIIGASALVYYIVIIMMRRRKYQLRPATAGAVSVLAQTAKQRTLYTAKHQKRVAELASAIAREMNLSKKLVKMLLTVGIIHDPGSVELPYPVAQTALQYHERLNGSGYPQKLAGDDILLEARILAVADTVETMSSPRPYRPAMGLAKALEEIKRHSSTLYDSEVVQAFVRLVDGGKFRFQTSYD